MQKRQMQLRISTESKSKEVWDQLPSQAVVDLLHLYGRLIASAITLRSGDEPTERGGQKNEEIGN